MYPLDPVGQWLLVDDLVATGLGRRKSGRGCVLCHQPIARDDGFGLSEGVCSTCIIPLRAEQPSGIREITRRLTKRRSQGGAERASEDLRGEEPRAA